MKIGITCYPTYGGSGAIATELGIELSRRGHEIHFISYAQPFRLPHFMERVFFHEVEMSRYPLFEHNNYSLSLAAMMHEVTLSHGLDLLHVHYAIPHATSAWIAREMLGPNHPLRIVTTLHGTDITLVGQERSFGEITRFSILRSDGITAVSDYLKRQTVDAFGVPEDRIEVGPQLRGPQAVRPRQAPLPQAVVPARRREDGGARLQLPAREAGARRGQDLCAHGEGDPLAPGADRRRAPTARSGRRAARQGVTNRVLFLGKQDSVAELLACADLLLLPSSSESFGWWRWRRWRAACP
jgi:glycosyltransferase involved in cell wall biosynthesis